MNYIYLMQKEIYQYALIMQLMIVKWITTLSCLCLSILDGDLLVWDKAIGKEMELSSMGIRVDKKALLDQLSKVDALDKLELPYHQKVIKEELPYTIGGGIGISRLLMLILGKSAIYRKTERSTKRINLG